MARRYDSKEAKRRILTACVRLFLEKGYTNTKVAEILKEADVSAGSFQNIFRTKDGVLTELIGMMFSRQFGAVRPLAANAPSPVYLYAVETALQLAMTELSENLRDIYVEAYTFPATAEIIHRSTTAELQAALAAAAGAEGTALSVRLALEAARYAAVPGLSGGKSGRGRSVCATRVWGGLSP